MPPPGSICLKFDEIADTQGRPLGHYTYLRLNDDFFKENLPANAALEENIANAVYSVPVSVSRKCGCGCASACLIGLHPSQLNTTARSASTAVDSSLAVDDPVTSDTSADSEVEPATTRHRQRRGRSLGPPRRVDDHSRGRDDGHARSLSVHATRARLGSQNDIIYEDIFRSESEEESSESGSEEVDESRTERRRRLLKEGSRRREERKKREVRAVRSQILPHIPGPFVSLCISPRHGNQSHRRPNKTREPDDTASQQICGVISFFFATTDNPIGIALRIILQRESKQWKRLKIKKIPDEEIIAFFEKHAKMRKLCLNICSTSQIFTNFKKGVRAGFNRDVLEAFSTYNKLNFKDGTKVTPAEARDNFDIRVVHVGACRTEGDAVRIESALQQLLIGIADKGVNGRVISMPRGCPIVKLSVVNTEPRGVGNQEPDHEKPVYNVFIGAATSVIDNDEFKNSDKWKPLKNKGTRVFEFKKPKMETLEEVKGCVTATRLGFLDKCRDRD